MSKTTWIIWFSICAIGGFYIRHWINTGSGQFKRFQEFF